MNMIGAAAVPRLLAVDDEAEILADYARVFADPRADAPDPVESLAGDLFGGSRARARAPAFDVALCRQGEEAVAAAGRAVAIGHPFALAFVDVRMPPGIDGIATAERLRAVDPDLHIAIVTGYSDVRADDAAARIPPADKLFWLQKPFRAVELRQLAAAVSAKRDLEISMRMLCAELEDRVALRTAEHRRAEARADAANQAKSRFLAAMSHELRTPLNSVIGFADLIEQEIHGPHGDPRYREYAGHVRNSGSHLLRLINDVLDISKLESDQMTLNEDAFSLAAMVGDAVRMLGRRAETASVRLESRVPADLPALRGDELRLKQAVLNLLANAIKFTPAGGRVAVAAGAVAGGLEIAVSDTGIGIAEDDMAKLFQPFAQVGDVLTRSTEGTGLGLVIARRLVELHGGTLTLRSVLGAGTTAQILLPAARIVGPLAA